MVASLKRGIFRAVLSTGRFLVRHDGRKSQEHVAIIGGNWPVLFLIWVSPKPPPSEPRRERTRIGLGTWQRGAVECEMNVCGLGAILFVEYSAHMIVYRSLSSAIHLLFTELNEARQCSMIRQSARRRTEALVEYHR